MRFKGEVTGDTEIPKWLGISQSDIETMLVVGGSANLDLQTTKENPSYEEGLVALQDIGEGMTYETNSDVYIKLNTEISSNDDPEDGSGDDQPGEDSEDVREVAERIGTAVEERIDELSDAFNVGSDLASWVNLITEVSDLISEIADASESMGDLPEWVPEDAERTYSEFSSGLRNAAEGISAVKNNVFDSEKFVELINAELSQYETGLSLNLLAEPTSDVRPTETQEYIGKPQILKFSSLAETNSSNLQPLAESGEFHISDSADWNMQSGNQNFQIQQLEANILRDKGGNAIKSFINEQANHISDLTYKLDLDGKGIDISKSSISEKEIVIVVGEQLIIPDRVDLVSNEEGEQSLLVTLPEDTVFQQKTGIHALPLDFEEANGQWASSETTKQLFESDLIQGFEYSEQAAKDEGLRLKNLSINTGRALHYKLEIERLMSKGKQLKQLLSS